MTLVSFAALAAATALLYVAGARVFGDARFGAVTAVAFAATPVLWGGAASLVPLPCVAGWLAALAQFDRDRTAPWALLAGACLGAGVYASRAAVVMMPLYLLLTLALLASMRAMSSRQLGLMFASFAVAVAPGAALLVRQPERFRQIVNAYHLYDADLFTLRQGIREMASWVGLTARTEVYYDYFNPAFLFLSGRVLLAPLVVLVPIGLYHIVADETTPLARLSLAGFLAAPFAASLTAQPPVPARMLLVAPFAAMVAAYGVKRLAAWYRRSTGGAESRRLAGS
jgi:hypothetical protein